MHLVHLSVFPERHQQTRFYQQQVRQRLRGLHFSIYGFVDLELMQTLI
jgi:hypothetical protein